MASPRRDWGAKKITLLILTVVVFAVMVKLGFWQLDRGNQKLQVEQALALRDKADPISIDDWDNISGSDATGLKISLKVLPLSGSVIQKVYWDNQTWQGKVGYLVFQPVKILTTPPDQDYIGWVELGFIPIGGDRSVLPQVAEMESPQTVLGRLYRKQTNPMSSDLMPETMSSEDESRIRIQNLSLKALNQSLFDGSKIRFFPYVIQPLKPLKLNANKSSDESEHLPHPWKPLPMASERHFGYALQWFSMASVLLGLALWFAYRQSRLPADEKTNNNV